jgi:hypothetical protein
MAFAKNILVVANVTATSDELRQMLAERAAQEPVAITLLIPAGSADLTGAQQQASDAVTKLRDAGLEVTGLVGNSDPVIAVGEIWDPRRYDEIIVSTLPIGLSKWLRAGLPERIYTLTGAPVTHVVASPAKPARPAPPVAAEHNGGLGGLEVLGWGAHPPAHRPSRPSSE